MRDVIRCTCDNTIKNAMRSSMEPATMSALQQPLLAAQQHILLPGQRPQQDKLSFYQESFANCQEQDKLCRE